MNSLYIGHSGKGASTYFPLDNHHDHAEIQIISNEISQFLIYRETIRRSMPIPEGKVVKKVPCLFPGDDVGQVNFAARHLEKSEFRLFAAAYRAWYGEEASDAFLEPVFSRYLVHNTVPFWVRGYVRQLLSDPELQKKIIKKRKVASWGYLMPLVFEFIFIMYFLLRMAH